jgi:hypothetical protein
MWTNACETAMWCKLLHDKGWTGSRIARELGRSEGYVNNLIRVVERGSPTLLLRWRMETLPQQAISPHACATDWLLQVILLPHEQQDVELANRIANPPIRR